MESVSLVRIANAGSILRRPASLLKLKGGMDVNVMPMGERLKLSPLHCQIW